MPKTPESLQPKDTGSDMRRMWRGEGDKKYRVNERVNDPLQVGREVTVQRSNGQLEGGWKISEFEDNGNVAVVKKEEGNEVLTKKFSVGALEQLNPPQG